MSLCLNILLVEDEMITALDLQETLEEAGHHVTAIARNYQQALEAVKQKLPDLSLIDIHLEGSPVDGIGIARKLLTYHSMPIIYLTANSEYQTFQLAKETTLPASYLLKPYRPDELKLQIELAYHFHQSKLTDSSSFTEPGFLYIPVDNGHEKIDPTKILYLLADRSYSKIFLLDKKSPYHISTNLSHLSQYFITPNFYRLSRSILINLLHVERLEQHQLFMTNHQTAIPIPAANRKELMNKLKLIRTK